jgi:putative ABC transport system ATP-binding protein
MDSRIDLHGVGRRYQVGEVEVVALHPVDLHVDQGDMVVILGPSGSGKTTLLNLIGALDTPTSGRIRLDGVEVTGANRKRRAQIRRELTSFIFQSFNLFPALTALENVQFGADVTALSRKGDPAAKPAAAKAAAARLLAQVGLGDRAGHFPHQLSGGEQQRVAIARALATDNPILLADEPTGELDFATGVQILKLLREQAKAGRTVLVVTHNREISRTADRVVELSSGRIVRDGPPEGGTADVDELRW